MDGANKGEIRAKKGAYKPSVIRSYETSLRLRVLPSLGDRRFTDITRADLLELKERLQNSSVSDSTIRNTFVPLQAIYRRAVRSQLMAVNPAADLELPSAGARDRAATPKEADEFLTMLADREAALHTTAFYAGLRRGESSGGSVPVM